MSRFSNKRRLGTPAPGGQQTQQPVADQKKENPKAPDRLELKAEGTGNYCIKLKWEPVDSNPELYGYRLERSPARRDIWTSVHEPLPVLPVKTTEFGVPVEPYKVYDFCVRSAIKIERKAIYSDGCYLDDVVAKKQYQPFPPRNIMVTDRTTKSVSLKWLEPLPAADVSPDSYEYVIEMCDYTDGTIDNWQVCCRTTELVYTVEVQHCETCCLRIRVSTHNKVNDVSSLPLTMGHPEVRITIEEKNGESIKTITSRWQVSHTTVNNIESGSVIFVVSCEDMTGLRELWMNYKLGKLKKFFQDLFALEASLASEVSDTDLDLNIRIHPKEFHSCRRHLMLTCATDRGFRVVNMEGTHLRANTQLGLSEDYPVYCKPLQRTTCSQLDFLDPAMPTNQIHVTVPTQEEAAVKVLLEHKKEIVDLRDAKKGMTESIKELTAEKTKLTDRLASVEAKHEIAQRQVELQEDTVRSLKREVPRLTQQQETAQKLLLDNKKEIEDLTGANKGMGDTIDELLAEKTKLTNKLAMVEGEGQGKPHKQALEAGQGKTKMSIQETSEQNTQQLVSPHQPSSANQFQQPPDPSARPPLPNLQTVPAVAQRPPISSPQHADAPTSPQQSTSSPGTGSPHPGPLASPPTPPHDTIPKQVPIHAPTTDMSSYQTPSKQLLHVCHGEVQSHLEGKQTTTHEMREQWEHASEAQQSEHKDILTSPKQFQFGSDTVGSLDKTPTLTEFRQHTHDATAAIHRTKHQQEEIQNEEKMTSAVEIQEQLGQLHLPDTVGSMDKTTSHIEMQQQLHAAQLPAVPAGIHQGAASNEENDLYLMEVNKWWEEEQAIASSQQAGILSRTPLQKQSNSNSNTPLQSSPSTTRNLDDDVVEDSPSDMQGVKEAASSTEYRTLLDIPYQSPSGISSNIGQSPVLGSGGNTEDLEVDSPTKLEDLETGPVVRPKIRPASSPEAMRASPNWQDVAQQDLPEGQNSEKVTLREYQKELARSALLGKNVIITCATGSGKTLVSALTAKKAWSEAKARGLPFKALFIVPIRNLTKQQKDQYEMLFPLGVVQEIGDTEELSETLKKKDIVMLTAQIVVNSLKAETLDLTDLDQLILDECHHTTLDHPYNQIMRYYLMKKDELKTSNPQQKRLPQVIGLTASLGVGESGNALQHLIRLCASLDASRVDHVKENKGELRRHVFTPDAIHILSGQPRRPHDPFSMALDSLMQRLESRVFSADTCPYDRGTQQCENWIVERKREAEATCARKELIVSEYLFNFNRALRMYSKLRAVDAIQYLDEKIYQSRDGLKGPPKLQIEKFCYQQYGEIRDELCVYAEEEETKFPNPMLQQLRSLLIQKFNEEESYGIVLTQQRRETEAIIQYVEEQEVLQGKMRAKRLVGQGKLEDKAITDAQQMAVLKSFRKGLSSEDGCNLLVATDVAQEGLDMPKCNFVIRYDFVSNEIGSVQARGRARAKDAECYLLVTAGSINERRELENQEKEKFMMEALEEMDKLTGVDFDTRVKAEQTIQLENWKAKLRNKTTRSSAFEAKEVKVYCRGCNHKVCDGTQIIHKGSNYICREPSLPEKCEIVYRTRQVYRTTDTLGVIKCGNPTCEKQYGPIIKFKKGQVETGYGMNVSSFMFDFGDGQLRPISKWSKAPFPITEEPYE
ncbi:uncharacterized protein LOC144927456 [Branchiostoma floridae x Branchiostoma belcheri]